MDYNPVAFIKHSSFKFNLILKLDPAQPCSDFSKVSLLDRFKFSNPGSIFIRRIRAIVI